MSYQHKVLGKSKSKALFLDELGEAVEELNNVLAGRAKAYDAYELLDVLDSIERRNEPTRSFEDFKNEILANRNT
ncbi:hypothetical protein GCM10028818_61890 [Spirosoma horti]